MGIPASYSNQLLVDEKVLYVLSLLKKAMPDEIAMEIMELQGTATEEGVAELTIITTETLRQLQHQGQVKMETESDKQTRYSLKRNAKK